MNQGNRTLYWLGNVAKARIIDEILTLSANQHKKVIIFDYGCGGGGDWPAILTDNPHFHLVGFEPNQQSYRHAVERLSKFDAELWTGDSLSHLAIQADYIVSFSVFEHVVDKIDYLGHAKRLLAPSGIFYLNYDDGHFRNMLDLSEIRTWLPALKSRMRTVISPAMALLGQQLRYQQRVTVEAADQLVGNAGFKIDRVDYHNLASLKELAKTIPDNQRQSFTQWWLDTEIALNRDFLQKMSEPVFGDSVNLFQQAASRTLRLNHR